MLLSHIHPVALFSSDDSATPNADTSGLKGVDAAATTQQLSKALSSQVTVTYAMQQVHGLGSAYICGSHHIMPNG